MLADTNIAAYWPSDTTNAGDVITPHLLSWIVPAVNFSRADSNYQGKIVGVGSILQDHARSGDIIWGAGAMPWGRLPDMRKCRVLCLRGPLSGERVTASGGTDPGIYGDPGLLVCRFYRPETEKLFDVGFIPHFYDYEMVLDEMRNENGSTVIDIRGPISKVIKAILECRKVVCSSLHGIVFADSCEVPAEWVIGSALVAEQRFKFLDYFAGTGRQIQSPGRIPSLGNLREIQDRIEESLVDYMAGI